VSPTYILITLLPRESVRIRKSLERTVFETTGLHFSRPKKLHFEDQIEPFPHFSQGFTIGKILPLWKFSLSGFRRPEIFDKFQ
jgi:hypothetical protein